MKIGFSSPAELSELLLQAGFEVQVTQLERGQLVGSVEMAQGLLRLVGSKGVHIYGPRKGSPFTAVDGPAVFHGIEADQFTIGGFNPSQSVTDFYLPAGSAVSLMMTDPIEVQQLVQSSKSWRLQDMINSCCKLQTANAATFRSMIDAGLKGAQVSLDEVLILTEASMEEGQPLEFDPDDPTALSRAVKVMAESLDEEDFDGQDLARLAHTSERWLRKQFKRYGTSPMAFRKSMRLAAVGEFARTEEGSRMSQTQLAKKFGWRKPKYLGEVYRNHFGENLFDVQRRQISLL